MTTATGTPHLQSAIFSDLLDKIKRLHGALAQTQAKLESEATERSQLHQKNIALEREIERLKRTQKKTDAMEVADGQVEFQRF